MRMFTLCATLWLVACGIGVALVQPVRAATPGGLPVGLPDWLKTEIGDSARFHTPGVYPLSQGRMLAVGQSRIPQTLQESRALRLATLRAEGDAKQRLARALFADTLKAQKDRTFTLVLSGAQVAYTQRQDNATVVLGLIAQAASAKLVPLSLLADCYDVRVAPLVETLLEKSPPLSQGGGAIFPQPENPSGWVGIGVGFAALPPVSDTALENKARTLALVDARRALTEAIFGTAVSTEEKSAEIISQGPGGDILRQWEKNTVTETVKGALQGAEVAGEWKTEDNHIAVALLIGRPPLRLNNVEAVSPDTLPQFTMEELWQTAFLQRPWLLQGGASLHALKEQAFLLVVEKGRLQGNPVADSTQLPVLIETKARNVAVRYLSGVQSQSQTKDTEERALQAQGADAQELIQAALHKVSKENVLGVVQAMRMVGSWRSADGKEVYHAYIIPLAGQ